MITKDKKVYYCEHCRKYGLSKSNIQKHEQFCFGNPENVPQCFEGCTNLDSHTNEDGHRHFFCKKKQIGLYTKKALVLRKAQQNPWYEGTILMPKTCEDYEPEHTYIPPQTDDYNLL